MSASKKVKARKMWAYTRPDNGEPVEPWQILPKESRYPLGEKPDLPVFVLPADEANYDKMLEQVALVEWMRHYKTNPDSWTCSRFPAYIKRARVALAAIGITRPATKETKA